MTLEDIMFDNFLFYPFAVTVIFVRSNASIFSHILDYIRMHEVVKWDVFEFIGIGRTQNWIVL